jgi:hypothetical protein
MESSDDVEAKSLRLRDPAPLAAAMALLMLGCTKW